MQCIELHIGKVSMYSRTVLRMAQAGHVPVLQALVSNSYKASQLIVGQVPFDIEHRLCKTTCTTR